MATAVYPAVPAEQAADKPRVRIGKFALPSSREDQLRLIQLGLFALGAALLPLG